MKFLPSPIPLLLIIAFDVEAATNMVLSAAKECNPNEAQSRQVTGSCEPGSHCVFNGNSSLDGYCTDDNDHKAADMDMPESMKVFCSVCDAPDAHGSTVWNVTKPHDRVGTFHCLELDGIGKEGKIPKAQCHLFQQMIQANNLCGCIATATEPQGAAAAAAASTTTTTTTTTTEPQDDDVLFYTDHDEENAPYRPSSEGLAAEDSSLDASGGSSNASAAASAIACLAAGLLLLLA
jgi:hypothetical protein